MLEIVYLTLGIHSSLGRISIQWGGGGNETSVGLSKLLLTFFLYSEQRTCVQEIVSQAGGNLTVFVLWFVNVDNRSMEL